ncbi:MAG: hypothetical protein ACNS62_22740 [Candidatus Cyclobacteriaceae bacterium M3_2C_046]
MLKKIVNYRKDNAVDKLTNEFQVLTEDKCFSLKFAYIKNDSKYSQQENCPVMID